METTTRDKVWTPEKQSEGDYFIYEGVDTMCFITFAIQFTNESTEAKVKQFAAAPELLEALIEINKMCADAVTPNGVVINSGKIAEISIAAIKKATL